MLLEYKMELFEAKESEKSRDKEAASVKREGTPRRPLGPRALSLTIRPLSR